MEKLKKKGNEGGSCKASAEKKKASWESGKEREIY